MKTSILPSKEEYQKNKLEVSANLKSWYEGQGRYHSIEEVDAGTYIPKKGDIFFKTGLDHSGLVTKNYVKGDETIGTVEGNTTKIKDNPNGYAVITRDRRMSTIIGFGENYYSGG